MRRRTTRRRRPSSGSDPSSADRAAEVIKGILRRAGGELRKAKISQAFCLAHLYFAKSARGYLTDWPIVRMPRGPEIGDSGPLFGAMVRAGEIAVRHEARGLFTEVVYRLTGESRAGNLSQTAMKAIARALRDVHGHKAQPVIEWCHEFSRSWNETPNGAELDIYTDLVPDDVYEERRRALVALKKAYSKVSWAR
jgi:hypothetical protein